MWNSMQLWLDTTKLPKFCKVLENFWLDRELDPYMGVSHLKVIVLAF